MFLRGEGGGMISDFVVVFFFAVAARRGQFFDQSIDVGTGDNDPFIEDVFDLDEIPPHRSI